MSVDNEILAMVDEHVAKMRELHAKHLADMQDVISKLSDIANDAFAQRDMALTELGNLRVVRKALEDGCDAKDFELAELRKALDVQIASLDEWEVLKRERDDLRERLDYRDQIAMERSERD